MALHTAQLLAHMRSALGQAVRPLQARFAHAPPPHADAYARHLGCACVFDAERHEIRLPKQAATAPPRPANPIAMALLRSGCDSQLAELAVRQGWAGCVARALSRRSDPGASMKCVADQLHLSDRTLRRRLAEEGTSFSEVSAQVQRHLATRQLERAEVSVEEVAARTGYSDAANFRRAFIRWTSMSPAQYRRMQRG